ncbi:hypothetical protein D043_1169A, partial [Vibrio parahaemolyticus EKP-021]
MACRI